MSHIGLIAPSGIFKAELIAEGVELLESWGHTVTRAPHLEEKGKVGRHIRTH
mgnify:CR=1 FL=1